MFTFIAENDLNGDCLEYTPGLDISALALLGALGIDRYTEDDICGEGEQEYFLDANLSAAEAALTAIVMPREGETEGLVFLASCREFLREFGEKGLYITIA